MKQFGRGKLLGRHIRNQKCDCGVRKAVFGQSLCVWGNQPDKWSGLFRVCYERICAFWHQHRAQLTGSGS